MSQIYSKLYLSLTDNSIVREIDMVQGDTLRGLDVFISDTIYLEGNQSIFTSAVIMARKPSGLEVLLNADEVINFGGNESYEVRFNASERFANIIAESGDVKCQISLINGSDLVTTFTFIIHVQESLTKDIESTGDYQMLKEVLKELQQAQIVIQKSTVQVFENPDSSKGNVGDLGIFTR